MQSDLRTKRSIARDIAQFRGIHAGEMCLLVGNGPNLHLTPPEWFGYPSFGMNTVHMYEGWRPDYYTAVDVRVMKEFGTEIVQRLGDVPKFVPSPNLDRWQGPNFHRFNFRPGPVWRKERGRIWNPDALEQSIQYSSVMHVAMQIAFYMGFTTLLVIGMQHKPGEAHVHFWGSDAGMGVSDPLQSWLDGYKQLTDDMRARGVKVINISEDTYVSENIIPRGNPRDWINN
jgi:hypothetical protein